MITIIRLRHWILGASFAISIAGFVVRWLLDPNIDWGCGQVRVKDFGRLTT